ncbi:MAG: MFS transporter [Hyphomicrobiaceae bacterium]
MAPNSPDPHARPDSALAWRMLAAAFAVGFVVFGVVYSFGVFMKPVMDDLGASQSVVSAYYAVSSLAFYLLGPLTGRIGDRMGPMWIAMAGALTMGGGLALTSLVRDAWTGLAVYGLGVGIGAACAYIPTFAIIGGWFDRYRTRALGIGVAGTGLGMLAVPPLVAMGIEHNGWRATMAALGAASMVVIGVAALIVRRPQGAASAEGRPLGEALRSRAFAVMYGSWVLGTMALFVPLVFLPAFAARRGVDPVSASWLISVIGGASIAGRLGIGLVGNTLGAIGLYKLSVLTMALSYGLWLVAPGYAWLLAFAALLGVAYGVRIALVAPVLIEFFGVRDLGALLGVFFTATGIAGLLGPLIAGFAVDATGDYGLAIMAAIAWGLLAFVVVLPLRKPQP